MDYGRLGPSGSSNSLPRSISTEEHKDAAARSRKRRLWLILLSSLAVVLIVTSAVTAAILIGHPGAGPDSMTKAHHRPTKAISKACSKTRYPTLCVDSLVDFPGALTASEPDLVHISVNLTLRRFGKALYDASTINNLRMETLARSAYEDCLELLDDSVELLGHALYSVSVYADDPNGGPKGSSQDVMTWLSAALTNHETCSEGMDGVSSGTVRDRMMAGVQDLSELVSNCLSLLGNGGGGDDFAGVPIQNRRRLMGAANGEEVTTRVSGGNHKYPTWMTREERKLLAMPISNIQADIVVSKDGGNGTVKTISEAIKKAPEKSSRRIIIYVKAGKYEENNLKVGRKKTNLMFIGDGKGKTVITGGRSVSDKLTTFHTASFAATGTGFIARDMSFENTAGPGKHQAVALRIGADHAVVYRCSIAGYQDTLYVHSQRQFFRECDISGTVDFIFGNAAVVLQNCSLYARKPLGGQKNTITAQNRKDPNQNTGISIHACRILAEPDLEAAKSTYPTYLGRPWKLYSRTVYLMSFLGDHVHPRGWLEWNATSAVDKLYYGEYMNFGPGAGTGQRVNWPGFRVITSTTEASRFTVAQFIYGSSWLPSTGVAYLAGLSV